MSGMLQKPVAAVFCEHAQTALLAPFSLREIDEILNIMLAEASNYSIAGAELVLTDDRHIEIINKRFLGCQGPTNIITFPAGADIPGSLYLSLDCLLRECLFYRQNAKTHFIRLLAHGAGHLAGLDHGPEMAQLEARLIAAVQH